MASVVYFLEAVGLDRVKIGTSRSLQDRLVSLLISLPVEGVILRTLPGGAVEERALHRRFAEHRVRGEWFVLSAIREAIEALDGTEAEPIATCVDCGKAKPTRRPDRAARSPRCRACARKTRPINARPLIACIQCGTPKPPRANYNRDPTMLCRPCAMRNAWQDPLYRQRVTRACLEAAAARCGVTA